MEQISSLGAAGDMGTNAAIATLPNLIPADSSAGMFVGNVLGQEAMAHAEQAAGTAVAAALVTSAAERIPIASRGGNKGKPVNVSRGSTHPNADTDRSILGWITIASRKGKTGKPSSAPRSPPGPKAKVGTNEKSSTCQTASSYLLCFGFGWLILTLLISPYYVRGYR
jgi:hypothetical protein